ncbi:MAG: A/G-specific adenine glycosylase [Deltaproteobacteria bacterium]|nr:A/G-specific adenine glycosylase [Deltaproteobacteria bacterium]
MHLEGRQIAGFQTRLLAWYDSNKRDLPFRKTKDPYKIWLSEIMLQQTTVKVVIDYYLKFTAQCPDVQSVANADVEDLLRLWQGLGYYSRIRNFKEACCQVVNRYRGLIPQTSRELRLLRGVGDYTAAAIASICFNEQAAVVDGNVKRVIARIFNFKQAITTNKAHVFFKKTAGRLLLLQRPGDFNQAMMELGALVCTPKRPSCGVCPILKFCLNNKTHPEMIPQRKKTTYRHTIYHCLLIHSPTAVILERPGQNSLIKGMWGLPLVYEQKTTDPLAGWNTVYKKYLAAAKPVKSGIVRHSITNKRISAVIHEVPVAKPRLTKTSASGFKWILKKDLAGVAVNTLSKKIINGFKNES